MAESLEVVKKVVVVGHVDHGKSTLLGRVLLDCGRVPDDKIAHVTKICSEKALQFEPAFLFDALQEEQEQGISIDTTRVFFEFEGRKLVLIDAPGHLEFLKNMTSGASEATLGILVVDCHQGVRSQTERHLKILSVLGIKSVIVALNKIDQVSYSQDIFEDVSGKIREIITNLHLRCEDVVPLSALRGENITKPSEALTWYAGKPLLPRLLDLLETGVVADKQSQPMRMLLQDVYRFGGERFFAGRVVSGVIRPGDEIFFSPSGKISKVEAIERFPERNAPMALPGDSVALQLSEQIFVERGEVISHKDNAPETETEFRARIAWLSKADFSLDSDYLIKIGTNEATCKLRFFDETDATKWSTTRTKLGNGEFADVAIKLSKQMAFDRVGLGGATESFVLCTKYETVAVGTIDKTPVRVHQTVTINPNLRLEGGYVERELWQERNNHKGTVLWLTGLSGAGKSTLAKSLDKALYEKGYQSVVLDGDNLRHGLCADLGFSPEERSENIRRIAHTSRLFLDRGFIVISACISPYAHDREVAREIVGSNDLREVFVFCPMEECQKRDPKGLYSKASSGQVRAVTGFDSPYQPPSNPALRLDSSTLSVEQEVAAVINLLVQNGVLPPIDPTFANQAARFAPASRA
ncbi:MAG TPA: adenylyl-sulfate kinase [Planktothrix sp.]|jgi:bifunctional enzyme CysN/CysC